MTTEQIKAIIDMGGLSVVIVLLCYMCKVFWAKIEEKDSQLATERTKREDLIREYVSSSASATEVLEKVVDLLNRLEIKVDRKINE
jgi:hypothetical protein